MGNDSNPGDSETSPWKTLAKVSSSDFPAGSTIYLKRGQTWNEQLKLPSSGVTIVAYGTGDLPMIDGSFEISGWTDEGSGIFSKEIILSAGEAFGNITQNGTMMTPVTWNSDFSSTLGAAASDSYSFSADYSNFAAPKFIIYIKPAMAPTAQNYRGSKFLYGIWAQNVTDIFIKNVKIQRFSSNGIYFENCQRCSADSVEVINGGGLVSGILGAQYIYAGNGIEYDTNSVSGTVMNATISNIFDSCVSPQTFRNSEISSDITFLDSTFDKCGFAGVEISVLSNGGTTGSLISNITISGVTITNCGKGWSGRRYGTEGYGIRILADSSAGTMHTIEVKETTITNSAGDAIYIGGEVGTIRMHRLNLHGNDGSGIKILDANATTLKGTVSSSLIHKNLGYGISVNAPNSAGLEVYHTTFYDNSVIQLAAFGINGSATIQNNLFFSSAALTHLFVQTTLPSSTVNNNCYNNATNIFGYNGSAYSTVDDFRANTGFEIDGFGGTVGLTNPTAGDFSLATTSDCKVLGSASTGIVEDFYGSPFASPPSSGALQYETN